MKRRILALIVGAALLLLPITGYTEGEEGATSTPTTPPAPATQEPTPMPTAPPANLMVDTVHVYAGMDRSYDAGYAPKVSKGVATVVLPLVVDGALRANTLTATPNLGDPNSAPFVFRSYMKNVKLAKNAVKGGTIASYLVRFDLKLKTGRVDGVYPVTIDIQATGADGAAVQQSYTAYVTITDGKDPNATPPPPEVKPAPKIIVAAARVDPSPVVAGQPFAVTVTLKNASDKQDVTALKITASVGSPDFAPLQGSDTVFIDKLAAGETADVTYQYRPALKTVAQQYALALTMDFNGPDGAALGATASVPFAVEQELRVQMDSPKFPENVNAGDTVPLSLQVMNLGRGPVYNVRAELDVPGLLPTETAFFGNMEAGSAKTSSVDVFVGTKDMSKGHEGDEEYGQTSGKLKLIYEDEDGKEYTTEVDVYTNIGEPVIPAAAAEDDEAPKRASQWWVTVAIGIVVVVALAAVLAARSRRGRGTHAHR